MRASLRRSDSELFSLVHTPELETRSTKYEMLSPSSEMASRIQDRTSIYELSSEESLLPAPLARVARKSQDEMDELFRHDAMVLAKADGVKSERKTPQIVVHLADQQRAAVRKPRRLRKMEKVASLRELKLGNETLDWD